MTSVFLLVALLLLFGAVPRATAQPDAAAQFSKGSVQERRLTLSNIAAGRLKANATVIQELLVLGLMDPHEEIRTGSLRALAATAIASRAKQATGGLSLQLLALRPRVLQLLNDNSPVVRRSAIQAIGNLELSAGSDGSPAISAQTVNQLAMQYSHEPSDSVRAEIVKSFALLSDAGEAGAHVLRVALSDSSPTVLQHAVAGASRKKTADALPRVAELLGHSAMNVRMAAAQAMVALAPHSRAYITDLERAAAIEPDRLTFETMMGSIQALKLRN